ncbi:MAG: hypothetical protein AAF768_07890 [Pseudomonadota bacterium]
MAGELAERLALKVLSRDNAHLAPATLTQAAARRMQAGLRALEAYVRRVLLYLALQIEPDLPRTVREAQPLRENQRPSAPKIGLRVFRGGRDFDPWAVADAAFAERVPARPVLAAPLLARLRALKTLALDPEGRARRLAWNMARRRPGPTLAPDTFREAVPRRYGTELSMLYDAMGQGIVCASKERPPPLGPRLKPAPRIRAL